MVRQRATTLSVVQLVQGFCFCSLPYTFRYMFVNACAFSEPRARATVLSAEGLHFNYYRCKNEIRESVDSLCRDGADMPRPPYIGKACTRSWSNCGTQVLLYLETLTK